MALFVTDSAAGDTGQVFSWTLNIEGPTTLGVDENSFQGFSFSPNPVKNHLTLSAQKVIKNISAVNMLGQEIMSASPNSLTNDLDMSTLKSGAYFVKVTINDATETIRVIKQ